MFSFFLFLILTRQMQKKSITRRYISDGGPYKKRLTRNVYLGVYRRKQNFADVRLSVYIENNQKQSKLQCKQSNRARALAHSLFRFHIIRSQVRPRHHKREHEHEHEAEMKTNATK